MERILVRVLGPPDAQGVAVLIDDDAGREQTSYMTYSPKLERVRRLTGGSFFGSTLGTDFAVPLQTVVLDGAAPDAFKRPEALRALHELQRWLAAQPDIGSAPQHGQSGRREHGAGVAPGWRRRRCEPCRGRSATSAAGFGRPCSADLCRGGTVGSNR